MFARNLKLVAKYGLYGGVVLGGGSMAVQYKDGNYDSLAIVRVTRTAYTAVEIGRVYHTMLYSKEWDRNSKEYIEIRSKAHQIGADKLLELCRANKGVYIKVGQHVGALDYLLPDEYVKTMRILHKNAPQNTLEELYVVMREEFKKEPQELFDQFEEKPLGTASLAQVHRAKLKDGTDVAVKVQHHYVRSSVNLDLKWMEFIIKTMSKIFPDFQMQWLVDETKTNITKELDFMQEGRNSEKLAEMFKDFKWLKVPKVYWDYCTNRVLVMEYVTGGQVNDIKYIEENKINKFDICSKLSHLYSQMIFIKGFVHSDPHPGNIIVKQEANEKGVSVYLLDHGLYAELTDNFRYNYSKLWLSILDRNTEAMKEYCEKMGVRRDIFYIFACIVTGRPWESIMKGIEKTKPSSEEKETFQNYIPNLMHYVTQVLQNVDRQALLVLKTNDLIRSIEHALGTQERMCSFMLVTKCCVQSVYNIEYKNSKSIIKRQYLTFIYGWSLFKLYLYGIFLDTISFFKRPHNLSHVSLLNSKNILSSNQM